MINNDNNYVHLCKNCIDGIWSRGEKIIKLDSLYYNEEYEEQEYIKCEFCEDEYTKDELYNCIFQ